MCPTRRFWGARHWSPVVSNAHPRRCLEPEESACEHAAGRGLRSRGAGKGQCGLQATTRFHPAPHGHGVALAAGSNGPRVHGTRSPSSPRGRPASAPPARRRPPWDNHLNSSVQHLEGGRCPRTFLCHGHEAQSRHATHSLHDEQVTTKPRTGHSPGRVRDRTDDRPEVRQSRKP